MKILGLPYKHTKVKYVLQTYTGVLISP